MHHPSYAHQAYRCKNWQRRCERSWRWTARACCLPRSAGPRWWRWRGLGVNWSIYETNQSRTDVNLNDFAVVCLYCSHSLCVILEQIWKKKKEKKHTHTSSMLGSVNCTKRSLSWSTPAQVNMVLEEMLLFAYKHGTLRWHDRVY